MSETQLRAKDKSLPETNFKSLRLLMHTLRHSFAVSRLAFRCWQPRLGLNQSRTRLK